MLEGSLHIRRWQNWLLQLGGRIIAHTLRHVLLELSLGGGGDSSRAFSIQHVGDIHS